MVPSRVSVSEATSPEARNKWKAEGGDSITVSSVSLHTVDTLKSGSLNGNYVYFLLNSHFTTSNLIGTRNERFFRRSYSMCRNFYS